MSQTVTWRFTPLDTWFFKQALAPDSLAAQELTSLFPPSPRTLIGALRAAVGEAHQVDWKAYREGQQPQIAEKIGAPNEALPPNTQFSGVAIRRNGQGYYPMPLNWLAIPAQQGQPKGYQLYKLLPDTSPIHCDLGHVCLPAVPKDAEKGAKPLEHTYISSKAWAQLQTCLQTSAFIAETECLKRDDLFKSEPRLGIARNNKTRKTEDGQLYQTKHLRLAQGISLEIDSQGWAVESHLNTVMLGGEGRLAQLTQHHTEIAQPITLPNQAKGLILTLTSPAHFQQGWIPDGFSQTERNGQTLWQGQINGVELTLICAVIGKAHREGGWNLAQHQSRGVESLVPAGSAYYFEVNQNDINQAWSALQNHAIGQDTVIGRGQFNLAVY
ncbi:type III-B CRISPR module-associated Cmr3 family protein [Thiomicrospira sp. R3]|uniref:type III-B CRISPR module-associated Cmr3 family protein n=1 Tax=Thiomicrospira sp. R3 TaxID=3035472 RepID=UPI00259AF4F6|nr:type III-B CRISPR module-associated Cmr3 family protein [Thiomicrospira sp. R3]WFE68510.1 type III-B CRISPR module-associated Cmr3 family protein [Thiomicrospira sp. R3]